MTLSSITPTFRMVGRYALHGEIASGGMATVHLGRLLGPVGFSRTVAIKRMHPQYAKVPEFVSMFLDEARLAARIQHPNVVQTLDVVATDDELFLVMEYVQGESLARLWRGALDVGERLPLSVIAAIGAGTLHGLHAVHEAKDEHGAPLQMVHRDVSPQNILVGVDGVARVLDFGVAKASVRVQTTREGQLKGKLAYMAPEQITGSAEDVGPHTDVYAAGVVLWEALTGERLFEGESEARVFARVLEGRVAAPSSRAPGIPSALDGVVLRALDREPGRRFRSAREMAMALEACARPAQATEVGSWVEDVARAALGKRAAQVQELESSSAVKVPLRSQLLSQLASKRDEAAGRAAEISGPPRGAPAGGNDVTRVEGVGTAELRSPPHSRGAALNFMQNAGTSEAPHHVALPFAATSPWAAGSPFIDGPIQARSPRAGSAQPGVGAIKLLLAIATAALVIAIAAAVFAIRGASSTEQAPPVPSPTTSQNLDPPRAPEPTAPVEARPPATPPPTATGILSPVDALPSSSARPGGPRPSPTARPRSPATDCDPPYVRDPSGVKVYKPECLK